MSLPVSTQSSINLVINRGITGEENGDYLTCLCRVSRCRGCSLEARRVAGETIDLRDEGEAIDRRDGEGIDLCIFSPGCAVGVNIVRRDCNGQYPGMKLKFSRKG